MEFEYEGSTHNLVEIVGEDNLIKAEHGDALIILKDGMTLLLQHFPQVDCTFGQIEHVTLKGNDVLAVQACAFNRENDKLALGRSYGELNSRNVDEFGMAYPISTLENRARNRAVIRHLGIVGVFSEEELARLPKTERKALPAPDAQPSSNGSSEDKPVLLERVKTLCSELGWDDAKRLRLYCVAMNIPKDTPKAEIGAKLDIPAIKKAIEIAEEKLAAKE